MPSASTFETEVLRLIDAVDEEFYHSEDWIKFQARGPALIGFGFGLWATYVFFRAYFGRASYDTLLVTISLVIATDTLAFSLLFTAESSRRLRQIRGSPHFDRLRGKLPNDALMLRALIKIRASLPERVTLRFLYAIEKSVFTRESLVRRAIEPLQ